MVEQEAPRAMTKDELVDKLVTATKLIVLNREYDLLILQESLSRTVYTEAEALLETMADAATSENSNADANQLGLMVQHYFSVKKNLERTQELYNNARSERARVMQESGLNPENFVGSPIPGIVNAYVSSQSRSQGKDISEL